MGSFTKLGAEIWRYFVTNGVPASGPWKVKKSEMMTWMTEVENQSGSFFDSIVGVSGSGVVDDTLHKSLLVLPTDGTSVTMSFGVVGGYRANYVTRLICPRNSPRFHRIQTTSDSFLIKPGQSVTLFIFDGAWMLDLTGDRMYVTSGGEIINVNKAAGNDNSDGRNGTTGAKKTLQAAFDSIYQDYDHASRFATIRINGGGVFQESIQVIRQPVGCPVFFIEGNGTQFTWQPSGDPKKGYCFLPGDGTTFEQSDTKYDASNVDFPSFLFAGHQAFIADFLTNMEFGACRLAHISLDGGGCKVNLNGYTVSGPAGNHMQLGPNTNVFQQGGVTVNIIGSPAIATWLTMGGAGGNASYGPGINFNGTPANGCQKASVIGPSAVSLSGNTLPGTVAASATNGGQIY